MFAGSGNPESKSIEVWIRVISTTGPRERCKGYFSFHNVSLVGAVVLDDLARVD